MAISPGALLIVGLITGIGGAVTYTALHYAKKGAETMAATRSEEERKAQNERIFGKGSSPHSERLGRGQTLNDLLPMSPEEGPPLPRVLALRWPWKK